MDFELTGRLALVTAASRGIGRAVAASLAGEGADVIICARGSTDLEEAAGSIASATGRTIVPVVADLESDAGLDRLIDVAGSQEGGVDILVHNAGGPEIGSFFTKDDPQEWRQQLDLHFFSAVRLIAALTPGMAERRWGRVIAVVSRTVKRPRVDNIMSGAVRLPTVAVMRTLATELGPAGVTFNAIAVGPVATERLLDVCRAKAIEEQTTTEEQVRRFASGTAVARIGRPEEVGAVCAFLASQLAGFVTGQLLMVDGGSVDTLF